jgi:stage II sporulation SpoAA-like protein
MSIQITKIGPIELNRPLVLEIRVDGKLTAEDYESFVPRIEVLIKKEKIRMLVELVDFHGWSAGALWEDTKFAARHFNDIDRIAIVGNTKWEKGMAVFCKPFTRATIRFFDSDDIESAKSWILQSKSVETEFASKVAK